MPLIIFKREGTDAIVSPNSETGILDGFTHRAYLPKNLIRKKWTLKSVNVLQRIVGPRMKWFEVNIPQLMPADQTRYSLTQEGATPLPREGLRFYPNKFSMDISLRTEHPTTTACVSTPNLNLGTHNVNEGFLEIVVTGTKVDSQDKIPVTSYELILEYN